MIVVIVGLERLPVGNHGGMMHNSNFTRRAARLSLAAVVGFFALFMAVPAADAATLSNVAADLQNSPVYVEAGNEADVSKMDAERLTSEVNAAGTPLYVAVIQASSLDGRTISEYTHELGAAVGVKATYAVVAGRNFYADSEVYSVGTLADQSLAENKSGGANAILDAFITGVGALANPAPDPVPVDNGTGGTVPDGTNSGGVLDPSILDNSTGMGSGMMGAAGAIGMIWIVVFGAIVVAAGGIFIKAFSSMGRAARLTPEQLAALKATIDEDVTEFGEEATKVDAQDPRLDDAGRADLVTALNSYDKAKKSAMSILSAEGATVVTNALQDGRYALACVQARLNGTALPERRPPCFFDPRHGPSVQDVMWAPTGGSERAVPACQACVVAVADGRAPAAREVLVGAGQQRMPYWMAGPMYGPYAGGYYSAWGGMLPGMMFGTMLAHPTVVHTAPAVGWMGGGGGGFGGGDFGGGGGFTGGGGGSF